MNEKIKEHLDFLYGRERGLETLKHLERLLESYRARIKRPKTTTPSPAGGPALDERDSILITYGDQFREGGKPPIETLGSFLKKHLRGIISGVHILPFAPYSSDDGFSVIDYKKVNPDWGGWPEVAAIGEDFRLMFDLVLNHISARSLWFKGFLEGKERYRDYFIVVPEGTDVSGVFRPRALPLLTLIKTASGEKLVWTTFSEDQVDLNFGNPELLLEMIDILLFYVEQGAQFVRLDAIAYLWKELGTPCIHLEQTHRVVRLFRAVFDAVAPWVMIITETNVPHKENISYFGNGFNEAQMVYQFSLPPLVLDAFRRGDAAHLKQWASTLGELEGNITFFNFLASHDGIGVLPAQGILSDKELQGLAELALARGGFVSYKATPAGEIPYELNISYLDAVADPQDETDLRVRRFLASQAIMLALPGVPGIYVHSLLGTPNFLEGVEKTGVKRTINRQKLTFKEVERDLADEETLRGRIFRGYAELLKARRKHPAFHPIGEQKVLDSEKAVFAILRVSPDKSEKMLCLHNTGPEREIFQASASGLSLKPENGLTDILTGSDAEVKRADGRIDIPVEGYQVLWLKIAGL